MTHPEVSAEMNRLAALARYAIENAPADPVLDEITQLVAQITGAPIALISFMDTTRLWIKSSVGLGATEHERSGPLCETALRYPDVLVIPDASRDPVFADHAIVTGEPHVRFFASVALRTAENHPLGILCIIDTQPRPHLSPELQQLLRVLGRQVMTHLDLGLRARELQDRERLLSAIFDTEQECLKLTRPDGSLQLINKSGLELIEADSLDQVLDQQVHSLAAPEYRNEYQAVHARALSGETATFEFRMIGLKGTSRWMEMHVTPFRNQDGNVVGTLSVTRDVSERKQAQMDLKASEDRLSAAQALAHLGSWELDLTTKTGVWSAELWRLHYQTPQPGAPDFDAFLALVHPDDRHLLLTHQENVQGLHASPTIEYRTAPAAGPIRFLSATMTAVRDTHGNVIKLVGTTLDITELRRADRQLRRLTESNAQGVLFWTARGDIPYANDAFLNIIGYSRADLENGTLNWLEMTPPGYAERDQFAIAELSQSGVCTPFEKEYVRKDGTHVPVLIGAAAFEDQPGEGVCFVLDLTERKRLERQFLRAQRLESIGTMSGGIAHDLNNVLAPIMLSIELLKSEIANREAEALLNSIGESARRGANMVRQLLTFARGMEGRQLDVNILTLIADVERIVNDTFLKHIALKTRVAPDVWSVHGDATQLHQLLLNLCVNARDAMPDGGTLEIAVSNYTLEDPGTAQQLELSVGPFVLIAVRDTGTGIPEALLDRVFDPFFTTKSLEEGTGLGLSTSLAIAKSHGGNMHVDSTAGIGTTFRVYLPALTQRPAVATPALRPEHPAGNGELILVVDDEPAIRRVAQRTLELFGYRVVLAANGTEAIAVYTAQRREIAVVLTDLMMPVTDGAAAIQALRQLDATLPIIAASGLMTPERIEGLRALDVHHILAKPFTAEQLLTTIHRILTEDRSA